MSISADGYVAGPNQSQDHPLGVGGQLLHAWHIGTAKDHPVNQQVVDEMMADMGATIMGRNMFGPVRGEWGDSDWTGWWGDEPPYHCPVFVLTHHPHDPIALNVTTFHFVTDGIHPALERARAAAGERNISIAGGASTLNQYLAAGLLDELRLHVTPCILGAGERVFDGVPAQQLERVSVRATSLVTHITYRPVRA